MHRFSEVASRLAIAAAISLGGGVAVTAGMSLVATSHADAARPPCHDSNGSRPGGTVYVRDGVRMTCDVRPPQQLAVTNVRTLAACNDMGGGYQRSTHICWHVDY